MHQGLTQVLYNQFMDYKDDFIYCEELGIDSDLQPLLDLEGVTLQSLRHYGHWRRGFSEKRIADFFGITVAEAAADIENVKKLLPDKVLARDLELRNQIVAFRSRSQEMTGEFSSQLSMSADTLLKRGQNPASVLKKFREAIGEEPPIQITTLRKQNNHDSIDEAAVYPTSEEESQLIAALRREDTKPAKTIVSRSHIGREPNPISPGRNRQPAYSPDNKSKKRQTNRRVTVRLDPQLHDRLQRHSHDSGIELSALIRAAVAHYIDGDAASKDHANMAMPAEALRRTGKYQVAGSDLKEQLRESFLQILAMAYVTDRRWPRVRWVKELYQALLPLYRLLETDSVGQTRK